jgi:signal transduction histidine kinase
MSLKVNILMVDDQPAKLLSYETILSSLGENLIRASSGSEALDHLLKTEVAVVLMDVCMPDVDGFELASMIRQHPRFQKTAIILISAIHLTDLDRIKGYEVGAVDYVPVPVIPEILRAKVGVFADLYRKTRELEELNSDLEARVVQRTADLESLAARLQEADRRKDQFLATLAHELRNPLAPIATAAKILQMKSSDDKDLQLAQKVIHRQAVHLTRLVDDLLDLSRITRNRLELRKERTDLNAVVSAALETSRPLIEQSGHELTVSLPPGPVYLDADVVRLSQVFTNLLNNSAKFTNRGGHISLLAQVDADTVNVRIKDSGIGILAEHLPHIAEPFYQLDSSLEKSHGGLGIGLALVWQLVEMHGGSVEASSAGSGEGSEFVVRLPIVKQIVEPDVIPESSSSKNVEPVMRILVVDDNRDSADALVLILQLEGHVSEAVYNGADALLYAEKSTPDAILLDIGMPQLNGYQVAQTIRKQPWGKNILLIAQTGWGQEDDVRQCQEAGFNYHFTKPIDFQKLKEYIANSRTQVVNNR